MLVNRTTEFTRGEYDISTEIGGIVTGKFTTDTVNKIRQIISSKENEGYQVTVRGKVLDILAEILKIEKNGGMIIDTIKHYQSAQGSIEWIDSNTIRYKLMRGEGFVNIIIPEEYKKDINLIAEIIRKIDYVGKLYKNYKYEYHVLDSTSGGKFYGLKHSEGSVDVSYGDKGHWITEFSDKTDRKKHLIKLSSVLVEENAGNYHLTYYGDYNKNGDGVMKREIEIIGDLVTEKKYSYRYGKKCVEETDQSNGRILFSDTYVLERDKKQKYKNEKGETVIPEMKTNGNPIMYMEDGTKITHYKDWQPKSGEKTPEAYYDFLAKYLDTPYKVNKFINGFFRYTYMGKNEFGSLGKFKKYLPRSFTEGSKSDHITMYISPKELIGRVDRGYIQGICSGYSSLLYEILKRQGKNIYSLHIPEHALNIGIERVSRGKFLVYTADNWGLDVNGQSKYSVGETWESLGSKYSVANLSEGHKNVMQKYLESTEFGDEVKKEIKSMLQKGIVQQMYFGQETGQTITYDETKISDLAEGKGYKFEQKGDKVFITGSDGRLKNVVLGFTDNGKYNWLGKTDELISQYGEGYYFEIDETLGGYKIFDSYGRLKNIYWGFKDDGKHNWLGDPKNFGEGYYFEQSSNYIYLRGKDGKIKNIYWGLKNDGNYRLLGKLEDLTRQYGLGYSLEFNKQIGGFNVLNGQRILKNVFWGFIDEGGYKWLGNPDRIAQEYGDGSYYHFNNKYNLYELYDFNGYLREVIWTNGVQNSLVWKFKGNVNSQKEKNDFLRSVVEQVSKIQRN